MTINAFMAMVISFLFLAWIHTLPAQAAPDLVTSEPLIISRDHQKITAKIDKVPLRTVLQELANQLDVSITLMGIEGNSLLSITFTNLSLKQGIAQLLQGQDYALLHTKTDSSQLKEIIVLARQGSSDKPVNNEKSVHMSPKKDPQRLSIGPNEPEFKNFENREIPVTELARQVTELVQLSEQDQTISASSLTKATQDQNPEIRATAMALLEELDSR